MSSIPINLSRTNQDSVAMQHGHDAHPEMRSDVGPWVL